MDNFEKLKQTLQNTKCYICQNMLSVAPITVLTEDSSKLCCGRCKDLEPETRSKGELYESLLSCLTFPCIYKKCNSVLAWGQVGHHEKECEYREINCPMYEDGCREPISLLEIEQHFLEKHKDKVQRDCVVQTVSKHHLPVLLLVDNEKFFVFLSNKSGKLMTIVYAIKPSNKYSKFNVKITTEKKSNFSACYTDLNIIDYDHQKHCFKHFTEKCETQRYGHRNPNTFCLASEGQVTPNLGCKHTMECINKRIDFSFNATLTLIVTLISNDNTDNEEPLSKKLKTDDSELLLREKFNSNSSHLRKILECSVCNEFMISRIYSCKVGHSVCMKCRSARKVCSNCNKRITSTRCLALERISKQIEVPCAFQRQGCQYVGTICIMDKHETSCPKKV